MKDFYKAFIQEAELFFVKKFITSDTMEKEYSTCLDIIFNVTDSFDYGRGIIAFNQRYGQGKSFFFEVINHLYKRTHKGQNIYKKVTSKDLVQIYLSTAKGEDPEQRLIEAISVKRLFIDDIGDEGEKKVFKNYANELNVIRFVLLKRYEWWVEKGWITYGTTNLTIDQIAKNYDGRVSDRLLQMCYWREFNFLKEGSFRQVEETRKLTPAEIKKSWNQFRLKKPVEKVDLEKYFNELIDEPDDYFEGKDISFWTFVKTYLIDKGLLDESEFKAITEFDLNEAKSIVRYDVKESKRSQYKNAPADLRKIKVDEAVTAITKKDVLNFAQNVVARKKFMELRTNKHKFK
jgi:Pyruvate/2-oxoglutarate dehydrogenase complex, dehydrogenase (E1) component, eukaryotic type, alpha subunit